jgi:hypothetical protein
METPRPEIDENEPTSIARRARGRRGGQAFARKSQMTYCANISYSEVLMSRSNQPMSMSIEEGSCQVG